LVASPSSVAFGQQAVGANSAPQTVTVTNKGTASGAISSVIVSNGAFVVSGSFSQTIAPGQNISASVSFVPSTTGTINGTLTITDAAGTASNVNLSGTGVVVSAVLTSSPASVTFGSQSVGATTPPQTVLVSNNGNAAATITSIVSSNPVFAVTGIALPITVSPSQTVQFGVTFVPSSGTTFSGTLTMNSTASNSPQTVNLFGSGVVTGAVLGASPASLTFGSQSVGATTPPMTVSATNSGNSAAIITSITSSDPVFAVTGITLPFVLSPTQSVQFGVTFAPTSASPFSGTLTISSTALNSPQSVTLSGNGVIPAGVLAASPSTLAFGQQSVGAASSPLPVTITNTGPGPASVTAISSSNPAFTVSGVVLPVSIGASQSIQVNVSFSPSSATSFSGTLTITSTASNSPQTVNLTGSGVLPAGVLAASPASLSFSQQTVGSPSAPQAVTITNTGAGPATVSAISSSNSVFTVSGVLLPVSIGPSQSIQVNATFTPTSGTSFSATLTITSTASNSPQTVALSGQGIVLSAVLTATPSSLAFGQQSVGATSSPLPVTIANSGNTPASVTAISSSNPAFTVSGVVLPVSIGASQSIQVNVSFSPSSATSFSGTLTITSTASNSPQTVNLTGSGVLPAGVLAASPASLSFGQQAVGSPSAPQAVTITNTGAGPATVAGITSSDASFTVSGVALPVSIGPSQSIQVNVTFTPTSGTSFSATLTITSTASNSPQTVALSGQGIALSAVLSSNPTSLAFGQQGVGITSSPMTLTLLNSGNQPAVINSVASSNGAFLASGLTLPASIGVGQTATLNVTFTPALAISYSATLTITSTATNSPLIVTLTGTGIGAQFTVTPTTLSFGNQAVNTTSTAQGVTVSNTGTVPLLISAVGVTPSPGEFSFTGPVAPVTVNSGSNVVFSVTFRPSAATTFSGFLNLTTNGSSTTTSIPLSGTGVSAPPPTVSVGISPATLDFGTQLINQTSAAKTVVLTNTGTANLTINAVQTTSPYSITGFTGATTLTPGNTLNLSVTFHPTTAATFDSMITVNSTAASSPDTVFITGQGAPAFSSCSGVVTLNNTLFNFGQQSVGLTGTPQTLDISNTGSGTMTLNSVASDNPAFTLTGPALPAQVNAGASAQFSIDFTPAFAGAFTGTLTITSTACNSPNTISLSGSGVFPLYTLSASSLSFGNQTVGSTSTSQTVTATNPGVVDITINTVTISPPQFAVQLPQSVPITLTPSQSADFLVTFTPSLAQGYSGTLTFNTNGNPATSTVSLSGTGTAAILVLNTSPTSIDFLTQPISTTSIGRAVLVTNAGNAPVTVSSVTTATPFAVSGFGGSTTLNPNQTITLTVTFSPTTTTSFSGTLTITSTATTSPNNVSLQGSGIVATGAAPYAATTDRVLRLKPATLVALGPAGFHFTDTTYGSRMVRVTDAKTRPDRPDREYHTPSSAETNTWAKDNLKFYIEGGGGEVIPYTFDPVTMNTARMGNTSSPSGGLVLTLRASPSFSYVDPDVIYGFPIGTRIFSKFTFSTGLTQQLHDPSTCVSTLTSAAGGGDISISGDDQRLLGYFGGTIQDTQNFVYVFDRTLGCRWLQTDTGQVGGQWGPTGTISFPERFLMHNARISKDGQFVRISRSTCVGTSTCSVIFIWDLNTLNVVSCSTSTVPWCGGHQVTGYGTLINMSGIGDGAQWSIRPLNNVSNRINLTVPLLNPPFPKFYSVDSHPSWNNVQANNSQPFAASVFRLDHSAITRPWDEEIIAIRTDTAQFTTWRFGFHRSRALTFHAFPKGNISQDGRFFMFNSDWEGTVVTATSPSRCCDAFIIELK
jgi:hypothetical protein